jgi:hypothetical protein
MGWLKDSLPIIIDSSISCPVSFDVGCVVRSCKKISIVRW